jgi:biotin operon repressor
MSHVATKLVFHRPGLHRDMRPAETLVLVTLADCDNAVYRYFPGQEYICSATNIGERAVRDHLQRLRERGLIDCEQTRCGQRLHQPSQAASLRQVPANLASEAAPAFPIIHRGLSR